ncbi:MAG: methionyl-tRNA formyltransferase [Prevotella sp.]|nr:methionyl-tRNA formyltransferase [Prevotella sp.]
MKKEELRIVFMGTPEFAVGTLQRLVEGGYNVVAVVTQPDKPVGRHQDTLQPSEVKRYALAHQLPVLQPVKMKDPEFIQQLRSYHADVQVVVAFRMLPEVVWAMPRFGTFNVHAALLPNYRGAAPINWAVINGETMTGVTTFFLDHDIDTGRIIMQKTFPIPDDADVEYVYDGLMHLGADIATETLDRMLEGNGHVEAIAQEEWNGSQEETLKPAPKIFKDTCRIDWNKPAKQVYDFVRGLSPYPGAWTTLVSPDGKETVLKIFKTAKVDTAQTGSTIRVEGKKLMVGGLELVELQLTGKKRMLARDFLNGFREIEKYLIK